MKRKVFLLQSATKVLNPNFNKHFWEAFTIPTMDITCPYNYQSWLKMRMLFLDTGKKYTSRIFMYMGVYCLSAISFFMVVILNYLQIITLPIPQLFFIEFTAWSIFLLIVLWWFLLLGARINSANTTHITILLEIKQGIISLNQMKYDQLCRSELNSLFFKKLREIYSFTGCDRCEKESKIIEAINMVVDKLQHDL